MPFIFDFLFLFDLEREKNTWGEGKTILRRHNSILATKTRSEIWPPSKQIGNLGNFFLIRNVVKSYFSDFWYFLFDIFPIFDGVRFLDSSNMFLKGSKRVLGIHDPRISW